MRARKHDTTRNAYPIHQLERDHSKHQAPDPVRTAALPAVGCAGGLLDGVAARPPVGVELAEDRLKALLVSRPLVQAESAGEALRIDGSGRDTEACPRQGSVGSVADEHHTPSCEGRKRGDVAQAPKAHGVRMRSGRCVLEASRQRGAHERRRGGRARTEVLFEDGAHRGLLEDGTQRQRTLVASVREQTLRARDLCPGEGVEEGVIGVRA